MWFTRPGRVGLVAMYARYSGRHITTTPLSVGAYTNDAALYRPYNAYANGKSGRPEVGAARATRYFIIIIIIFVVVFLARHAIPVGVHEGFARPVPAPFCIVCQHVAAHTSRVLCALVHEKSQDSRLTLVQGRRKSSVNSTATQGLAPCKDFEIGSVK